jgi:hypothetical protein
MATRKENPVENQDPEPVAGKSLDRRTAVAAAAAALSGAALAKLAGPDDAEASHNTDIAYDSQTVVHSDVTNTTSGSTRISSDISGTAAFVAMNNYPVGISRPDGILGRTSYTTSNCAGVAGASESATGGIGVMGAAKATNGVGVYGFAGSVVPSTVGPAGTGVYGSGPNRGVSGLCTNGDGVHGATASGIGVHGVSTGAGKAARFEGVVEAIGAVPAVVVTGSDGSSRRTYPHASLSPVFEHVGQARLRNGRAKVPLPHGFDTLVPGRSYQVFLTEYGDHGGLFVKRRNRHSFEVRSRRAGAGGVFGFRVVVLRADLKN